MQIYNNDLKQVHLFKINKMYSAGTSARSNYPEMFNPEACNFTKKETLAQAFFCEFCEISKNTFYYRTSLVAASVVLNTEKSL